ncbi:MAG: 1-acyl-sn-glycerol-3-phosphate acyltransferase [Mollicutes bacterium]|nr:1-acyl-sn-glycerol-3-phosphate acyltransferase [Mollicutes bacterium]
MKRETHYYRYKFIKGVLGGLFRVLYRPKIINKEVIPVEGPIIVAGNHVHLFDQNLAIMATKRMLHYMAKIEYFQNWKTAWFFKMAGCIPVNRQIKDENAKSKALDILNNGYALGVFPEGTRNKTNTFLLPFKFGVVSMAQKTGATIVPFAITGEYKIFKKNHLNIRFGEPFKVPKDMDLEKANQKLFDAVSSLKRKGLEDIKNGIC